MKRGVVYIILFILSMSLATAATNHIQFSISDSSGDGQLGIVRYSPIPVEQGQSFDLWISFETQEKYGDSIINLGSLSNVQLEFVEEFPFSLDPGEEAVQYFGTVDQGERVVAKYRVHVDESAGSGDHKLKFLFTSGSGEVVEVTGLEITVEARDTTMSIIDISTNPEKLSPGEPADLSIKVRNDALIDFRNIKAVIDIDGDTIPIVPYKSSKEQTLRNLGEEKEYTFKYSIIAEEDAAAGVYKIPFTMTYSDDNDSVITREDTFGILIGAEGDLEFNLEEFETLQKGMKGDVVVSVSNVGPSELKFMSIELLESEDYVVIGRDKEYLGNLDSDDFETSTFNVYVKDNGDIPLQLKVTYKDTYNEEFEETFQLDLPVYTKGEIRSYGLDGNTKTYLTYLLYLLILLFLFYTYKDWREEKRIDQAIVYGLGQLIKLPFRFILFFRPKSLRRFPRKVRLFFSDL